ncbi:hypothetical protein PInf_007650 [Phytophthora infestans]|nr:hypothetical protein PInf_007650 [Phytophthora infestans]
MMVANRLFAVHMLHEIGVASSARLLAYLTAAAAKVLRHKLIVLVTARLTEAYDIFRTIPRTSLIDPLSRAAAYDIFRTILRTSLIDPLSEDGKTLDKVAGKIAIKNVSLAYPSRLDVQVYS